MGTIRVVFDTNVVVSALGFGGRPLEALLRAFGEDIQLIASNETLRELERVLAYDHLSFTEVEQARYPHILGLEAEIVVPEKTIEIVRDSDDDKFLECALEGNAEYIVSGDGDLLELQSYRGIRIITPAELLDILNN